MANPNTAALTPIPIQTTLPRTCGRRFDPIHALPLHQSSQLCHHPAILSLHHLSLMCSQMKNRTKMRMKMRMNGAVFTDKDQSDGCQTESVVCYGQDWGGGSSLTLQMLAPTSFYYVSVYYVSTHEH